MGELTSFALSAADSAIGNLMSGFFNNRSYNKTKKLMAYQNQLNIENWNRVNEYNDPKNQMARYRNAGLNPNLVYGNLQNSAAGEISSPNAHQEQAQSKGTNFSQSLMQYYAIQNYKKQNEVLSAQADGIKAEAQYKRELANDMAWKNSKDYRDASLYRISSAANLSNQQYLSELKRTPWAGLLTQSEYELNFTKMLSETFRQELLSAQKILNLASVRKINSDIAVNATRILLMKSEIQLNGQQIQKIAVEIGKLTQETQNLIIQGEVLKQDHIAKQLDNIIFSVTGRHEIKYANQLADIIMGAGYTVSGSNPFPAISGANNKTYKSYFEKKTDEISGYGRYHYDVK